MNNAQEKREVARIEAKIKREGRRSLTTQEENIYSYSRYGNGGGCPSHSAPRARDVTEHFTPPNPN